MKKTIILAMAIAAGVSSVWARPVTPATAQQVARAFYIKNSSVEIRNIALAYTATSPSGNAYYAFNINDNDGFVIVSAEDAAMPILGYNTKNQFKAPEKGTNFDFWMGTRVKEINNLQQKNISAPEKIANQWALYTQSNSAQRINQTNSVSSISAVPALVQSTWNQSPYYNALCPGGSVTGCVATAMAQIMRYWKYPAHGTGSSSYTQHPNPNGYPAQSANYGTTTYNWDNMPLALNGPNSDVALLNYQCGVSVDMNYDPSGSGAWVCTYESPICAQHSYITYFGYDPTQIKGLQRSDYDDASWIDTLKSDINIGRPIQYEGDDPSEGGHTWLCDGYDANNMFHMNWGWGGYSNGYFDINNLATPGFDPSVNHGACMGIVPMSSQTIDAGVTQVNSPAGFYCNTSSFTPSINIRNYGSNILTYCGIYYQLDNGPVQSQDWYGSLVSWQSEAVALPSLNVAPGTHTLVCYTGNPNGGTDGDATNNSSTTVFYTTSGASLPVVEGFENGSQIPSDWTVSHTGTGTDWTVTSNAAATGVQSCMIDNSANSSGNNSIIQTSAYYDLSTYTSPALSFKLAYQQNASSNNDKLQVFVSTDCGSTWISRWARNGSALATVSGTSSGFTPTPSQFTTYTVSISNVTTSHNVMFRWEFFAGSSLGNSVYLDDINIVEANSTGIKNIEEKIGLSVYPNPSSGKVSIGFTSTEKQNVDVKVIDMLGRVVETIPAKEYQAGENTIDIGTKQAYQSGVYMAHITINGQLISKKIVIQ